jgi:hypothetical protein
LSHVFVCNFDLTRSLTKCTCGHGNNHLRMLKARQVLPSKSHANHRPDWIPSQKIQFNSIQFNSIQFNSIQLYSYKRKLHVLITASKKKKKNTFNKNWKRVWTEMRRGGGEVRDLWCELEKHTEKQWMDIITDQERQWT